MPSRILGNSTLKWENQLLYCLSFLENYVMPTFSALVSLVVLLILSCRILVLSVKTSRKISVITFVVPSTGSDLALKHCGEL